MYSLIKTLLETLNILLPVIGEFNSESKQCDKCNQHDIERKKDCNKYISLLTKNSVKYPPLPLVTYILFFKYNIILDMQ